MSDHLHTSYFADGKVAPDLLTESEAVKFLRIDTLSIKNPSGTLRRYRDAGLLRGVQISKGIFYPLSELRRFIDRQVEANPR